MPHGYNHGRTFSLLVKTKKTESLYFLHYPLNSSMTALSAAEAPLITCLVFKATLTGKPEVVRLHTQSTNSAGIRTILLERYRMEHGLSRFEVPTAHGIYDFWYEATATTPNTFVERYLSETGNPFLERGLEHLRYGNFAVCFRRFAHNGITCFANNGWTTFPETSHTYWQPFKYVEFPFKEDDWREELPKHLAETHVISSLATLPKIIFYLEGMYVWRRNDVEEDAQKAALNRHALAVQARMASFGKRQHLATVLEIWDGVLSTILT